MDLIKDYSSNVTKGRLAETLALLSLAVVLVAFVPVWYLFAAAVKGLYILVVAFLAVVLIIFTLGTILLNEEFKQFFQTIGNNSFLVGFRDFALKIDAVMIYLLAAAVLLAAAAAFIGWKNQDKKGKKGKYIALTIGGILILYSVLYFIFRAQIFAEVII